MRATRGNKEQVDEHGDVFIPPKEEIIDDRVQCQFCNRKFNDKAAERHIPFCEEKFKKNQIKGGTLKGAMNQTQKNTKK